MKGPICLDSHILIWGLLGEAEEPFQKEVPKAQNFLKYLDIEKIPTIIPTPVIAEIMMGLPPNQHSMVLTEIKNRFDIKPFGTIEASILGKLWQDKNDDGTIEKIKKELLRAGVAAKSKIKFDLMILATAVAWNAEKIISYDDPLKKLGENIIPVEELPNILTQQLLF